MEQGFGAWNGEATGGGGDKEEEEEDEEGGGGRQQAGGRVGWAAGAICTAAGLQHHLCPASQPWSAVPLMDPLPDPSPPPPSPPPPTPVPYPLPPPPCMQALVKLGSLTREGRAAAVLSTVQDLWGRHTSGDNPAGEGGGRGRGGRVHTQHVEMDETFLVAFLTTFCCLPLPLPLLAAPSP